MSYTRTAHTSVSKTVTISYPASESGGSRSVSVDVPVDISVHVDTTLYDSNVASCNRHIDLLTGAVVATEAAEISSKRRNAEKVGHTITSGFFGLVRSEISQQVTELKTKVDSIILHLVQLKKGCVDKEAQMTSDFNRISSRYAKTFTDLDNEIVNRVSSLDQSTFGFSRTLKEVHCRAVENSLLGAIAVGSTESSYLQSVLYASSVKRKAQTVILGANKFIVENCRQNRKFESVKFDEYKTTAKYIPVIFTEFTADNNSCESEIFGLKTDVISLSKQDVGKVERNFAAKELTWSELSATSRSKLSVYFNDEMATTFTQNDTTSDRVKAAMMSMWENNNINVLSNN